jgi:peptide/nickel transport system substrate-binding protein
MIQRIRTATAGVTRRRAKRGVVLGATIACIALLTGCTTSSEADEPITLRVAVTTLAAPNANDAYSFTLYVSPTQAVYESLVFWNPTTLEIDPWLAEDIAFSDDRKTMTLRLRDDVDFTDGEHMTASGVIDWLTYLYNRPESWIGAFLTPVYGAPTLTELDEYTIEFKGERPFDYDYLTTFAQTPIASSASILENGEESSDADAAAGSGPYILKKFDTDVSATLERNPEYWNPDAVDFDKLVMTVYADRIAALNALKTGQLDAAPIDSPAAGEAEAAGLSVATGSGTLAMLAIIDREGKIVPALGDKRVRQAMNLAFDRGAIMENLEYGFGAVSSQPFLPNQEFYVDGAADEYGYDPERARELLAEAGYPDGFALTVPTPAATDPEYSSLYEPIVQQSLADIGITVTFEPTPDPETYSQKFTSGEAPVRLYKIFSVNVVQYFGYGYLGPDIDPEFTDLTQTWVHGTAEESSAAAKQIGEFLVDQVWFIPFSQPKNLWATVPGIDVVVGNTIGEPHISGFTRAD